MYTRIYLFFFLIVTGFACHSQIDLEKDKKEILLLHDQQRKAHLDKDVSLLLRESAEDMAELNHGVVSRPGRAKQAERFQRYFDAVEFIAWDDLAPPEISISEDGTMATSIVQKMVVTTQVDDHRPDTAYYAWLAVYKKEQGRWMMQSMASTNR